MKKCVFTRQELIGCTSEPQAKVFIRDKLREHGFVVSDDGVVQEPHTRSMNTYEQELVFEGGTADVGRSEGAPQMFGDSNPQGISGTTTGRISSKGPNTSVSAPRGVGRENESAGS